MPTRRDVLGAALSWAALGTATRPLWAHSARHGSGDRAAGPSELTGTEFELTVDHAAAVIDGRRGHAVAVNGQVPGPLLRWREGDEVTLRVTNRLADHDTSIHWHGILLPPAMDGVPGLSFPGIAPGETFTYRFPVRQAGTYWYHSHSGLQEQIGQYGPLVIEPRGGDPVAFDREYVVVLSDWTFQDPHRLFSRLKKQPESFNFQRRTLGDFFRDARRDGLGAAWDNRTLWGAMRMSPTDLADVTAAGYTYLVNGRGPADNWTALFEPGQRVRLRVINASAMTIFNVRIPGLPLTVVQSDGLDVEPLETDEFQIGVAETYDVVVRPERADAFTLMAETIDRSGYARATLAPRAGMEAAVPALRPRPLLTMKDMGHGGHGDHGGSGALQADSHAGHHMHGAETPAAAEADPHAGHAAHGGSGTVHEGQSPPADPHAGHTMHSPSGATNGRQAHPHPNGVGNQMVATHPVNRLGEPGVGLEDVPHRTLTYAALRSREPNPDTRPPGREIELHLTGNMERYLWSFDGVKFSQGAEPIVFRKDERARLTFVNDTMMSHPIHLHGMFFEVDNGGGDRRPRKHTIVVKPGEKLSVDLTADAVGDWAFHCHLLYHMHAGMMRVVAVREDV